jgi:O-antigen/teichoic acid export membrane protein
LPRSQPAKRSFGANAIFNVISWLVPAIALFVALPITVRGLGPDRFGMLVLISALTSYLGLMDLGLGAAIIRYTSYYRALNEGRPIIGIVRFAFLWFFVAGVVGAAILAIGAPWITQHVLRAPAGLVPTVETVVRLSALNFFLVMLLSVASAIPQGFLRYDINAAMACIFGTLSAVGPAVLVSLGHGLASIVVFYTLSNASALCLYSYFALRLLRGIPLSAGPKWKTVRRKALSFAGLSAATRLHGVVASQTSRLIVGIAGGASMAAFYQVPNQLSANVNQMLNKAASVMFPTGADLMARNDSPAVTKLYLRSSRLLFLVNGSFGLSLCVFAAPLLRFWVSALFAREGAVALVIFTITMTIDACSMAASNLTLSAGRPGVNLAFSLSCSVITLATVYPLTVHFGIPGAALAGLLGVTNVPFALYYQHTRILMVSSRRVWHESYRPTVMGALLSAPISFLLLLPLCHSLASTLLLAAVGVAICMSFSALFGAVTRQDLATARRLTKSALTRHQADLT